MNTVGDSKSFEQECPALTKLFGTVSKANDAPIPAPGTVLKGGISVIRVILKGAGEVAKVAVEVLAKAIPMK